MTQKLQRFDFTYLRDLRGPITARAAAEDIVIDEALLAPPEPTYGTAELEAARMEGRKAGFAEGFEAGQAQAKKDNDALMAEANIAIRSFGEALVATQNDYRHVLEHESTELSNLILMIAKKVAGDALKADSTETIMAMVTRCLPVLFSKPRVMVDVHPDAFEKVIGRVESTLQANGFEGEMQFRANPAIGPHDITLDWGSGQASRNTTTLWQEIEALVERIPLEITFAETLNHNAAASSEPNPHTP